MDTTHSSAGTSGLAHVRVHHRHCEEDRHGYMRGWRNKSRCGQIPGGRSGLLDSMFEKHRARIFAAVMALVVLTYVLGYGAARASHRLVHYESNCIARGNLDGRLRDFWNWPYRCSELRRSLSFDFWETTYAPFIALEEAARDLRGSKPSVCTLPETDFPSQGFTRPAWCTLQ
jgi:hypothetical protein